MNPHHNTNHLKAYCSRWLLIFSILFATCYAVVFICYELANADVLYQDSILMEILYATLKVCHSLFFSVIFGFLLYGIYRLPIKEHMGLYVSTLGGLVYFALISLFGSMLLDAKFSPETMRELASAFLVELLSEILVILLFSLLAHLILRDKKKSHPSFPYSSLISFRNPMQLGAFVGAWILFLPTLIENVSFDIYYGAPDSPSEWGGMLLYYLIDTLVCLILPYVAITTIAKKAENTYQKL